MTRMSHSGGPRDGGLGDPSFDSLQWLLHAADTVGSQHFAEAVQNSRFHLTKALHHSRSPGRTAIVSSLAASLDALIQADADARRLLREWAAGLAETCSAEVEQLLAQAEARNWEPDWDEDEHADE